jgi:vancomycin resistance protein YoaR
METHDTRSKNTGSVAYLVMGGTLFVASVGLLSGYYLKESRAAEALVPQIVEDSGDRGVAVELVAGAARELLQREVVLQAGEESRTLTWAALGLSVDEPGLEHAASLAAPGQVIDSLARAAAVPLTLDRERAAKALEEIAAAYHQAPMNARMDLEARTIHKDQGGRGIDVYGTMGRLEEAARSAAPEVELATISFPADVTVADLGIDDISHVLASFETEYKTSDFSRNFNLKLAASKLNGHVLQPGQDFSFNDVVGARTEKEGYKIAHVITSGEMVDGLAGGTCQISTTLHGAAFFAGLGINKAIPHSRPSTYVTMGMDATVVYPSVDLQLKNEYDFPVVIHYQVTRGKSVVEILGRERPYDKVVYEREIQEELEFDTVTREDDTMPVGSMMVEQYGFFGYKVAKIRKYMKDGKMVKRDRWNVRYAPVTEYVRTGINPDPNLPKPKSTKHGGRLREPGKSVFHMEQ